MDELKLVFPDLPYAVEEAMNRLRINVKFQFIEQIIYRSTHNVCCVFLDKQCFRTLTSK